MDNQNINSSKFCGSCGKELKNATQFCPYCGQKIDVSVHITKHSNRKGLIITLVSVVLILLIVISGISFATNSKTDIDLNIKKKTTAQEYLNKTLLSEYQLNTDNIVLDYKHMDGGAFVDCSEFKDSILDYKIADFNNDGDNDIYVLALKKDPYEYREDNYSKLTLVFSVYLADGDGNFDENSLTVFEYEDFNNHRTLNDYYSTNYNFALHQTSDSAWYVLTSATIEDDQQLYEEDGAYYPIEDSLGRYSETLNVYRISNMGILDTLYINRDIDHLIGIPEAESYDYYMGLNNNGYEKLISGGVNRVTTGDNYPKPVVSGEVSGPCSSESEACEKINAELDKYELQDYHLKPFKWENRFENGFSLDKNSMNPFCLQIHSTSTNDNAGILTVQFE